MNQSLQRLAPENPLLASTEKPQRRLCVRALIDGRSQLYLWNRQVFWVHSNGKPPGLPAERNQPTYLNEVPWWPRWTGARRTSQALSLDAENSALNLELPTAKDHLTTELIVGRGDVITQMDGARYPHFVQ